MDNARQRKMKARIISLNDGLVEMENLRLIRIKSRDYNLLIMEDYLPVIGEVQGDITLVSDTEQRELKGVNGFYMHKKNEFDLLVKEDDYVE